MKKYADLLVQAEKVGIKKGFAAGLGMGATMFIFFGTWALALWYGGKLVTESVSSRF